MARYIAKNGSVVLPYDGAYVTITDVDTDTKAGAKLFKQLGKAGVEEHFVLDPGHDEFTRPDKPAKRVESATAAPGEKRGAKK